ncbi:MAG: HAMP domain-containing sensor histidine kinase [Bacteroidales bacterium]|jgi:signal transduction histidine kinase|nr:HAMP domain-containing sensor histidine kinase [Bacteroidales bacterium]
MFKFKSFRLLTKTSFFYLIFILVTFFISGRYLIHKADEYINEETEHFFRFREHHVEKFIKRKGNPDKLKFDKVTLLDSSKLYPDYPKYIDTLLYNDDKDEYQLFRKKSVIIQVNGQTYLLQMLINIDDFTKMKSDVASRIVPAFIILALVIVIFTTFLSGFLFQPFYRILSHINRYKVGKGMDIPEVKTSSVEFQKLQLLFHRMVNRIEDDYRNLKEYTENMAHEIQTPLTIIRNKTERLIADERIMKANAETVKTIYEETNHLSKLGNALNLLTKIENGEYDNTEVITTKEIILKHIDAIDELLQLKSMTIATDLSDEHQIVLDPFLFDILLKNLIRNAIRYGSNKGPIGIKSTRDKLTISNYGDKLPVFPEKIFERFYSSNSTGQSLGLGLSLTKRICDLNQLMIDYEYANGQHFFMITNKG